MKSFETITQEAQEHAEESIYAYHYREWIENGGIEHLHWILDYDWEHVEDDVKDDLEDYEEIFGEGV